MSSDNDFLPHPEEIKVRADAVLEHDKVKLFLKDIDDYSFWREENLMRCFKDNSNNFERAFGVFLICGIDRVLWHMMDQREIDADDMVDLSDKLDVEINTFVDKYYYLVSALRSNCPSDMDYQSAEGELFHLVCRMLGAFKEIVAEITDEDESDWISASEIMRAGIRERATKLIEEEKDPIDLWFGGDGCVVEESDYSSCSTPDFNSDDGVVEKQSPNSSEKPWESSARSYEAEVADGEGVSSSSEVDVEAFDPKEGLNDKDRYYVSAEVAKWIQEWRDGDQVSVDGLVPHYVFYKVYNLDLKRLNQVLEDMSGDIQEHLEYLLKYAWSHNHYDTALETAVHLLTAFPKCVVGADASIDYELSQLFEEMAEFLRKVSFDAWGPGGLIKSLIFLKRYDTELFGQIVDKNRKQLNAILVGSFRRIEQQRTTYDEPIKLASAGYILMELSPTAR